MSRKASAATSPEGLELYPGCRVGRALGQGSQSVVHALQGREMEAWVVKLAKAFNPKLKGKAKEQNQDALTLNGERTRYKVTFRHNKFCPNIPDLNSNPRAFEGTTQGMSLQHTYVGVIAYIYVFYLVVFLTFSFFD